MIAALLIALIVLGLPTLYFTCVAGNFANSWRARSSSAILSLPCQSVGAAAGHQACRDARNQRVALHHPFHFVWALPLLRIYQKTESLGQVTKQLLTTNLHDHDATRSSSLCHGISSVLGS